MDAESREEQTEQLHTHIYKHKSPILGGVNSMSNKTLTWNSNTHSKITEV